MITVKRSTSEGIKTCSGEFFEYEGFQYCIGLVEYSISAIELSTGFRSAEAESVEDVKSMVIKRSGYMDSAIKKARKIMRASNIPYPLNSRIKTEGHSHENT